MQVKSKPIDLPSEGYFYPEGHPLSDGKIEIRHMTAADEDILTDEQLIQKGEAIDELLKSVIVEEGVELGDVLNGDVSGIMLATRILAYGPQYPFKTECPVCGESNQKTADLTEIQSKDVPFEDFEPGQTEFSLELPVSGSLVSFSLLKRGQSKQINTELDRVKRNAGKKTDKGKRAGQQVSTNMTTRLRYLIQEVDGDRDPKTIRDFVQDMPARDSLELRNEVSRINPDIDLTYDFVCDFCGHAEDIDIPLDETFFFPTR
jgi:hypothetical protein